MDLRVLILTGDVGLSELVRAQVENLGCSCSIQASYDAAEASIGWADAAIIDLVGDGLDDLNRLRVEAPRVRVLAIAPDAALGDSARSSGAVQVLVEPFAISSLVDAVRALGPNTDALVVDLRTGQVTAAPAAAEAPWWATR